MWWEYFSFKFCPVFHQSALKKSYFDQNWAKTRPLLFKIWKFSNSIDSRIVHWLLVMDSAHGMLAGVSVVCTNSFSVPRFINVWCQNWITRLQQIKCIISNTSIFDDHIVLSANPPPDETIWFFSSISRMVTTEKNVRTPHHQSFKGNFHQTCDYFDIF